MRVEKENYWYAVGCESPGIVEKIAQIKIPTLEITDSCTKAKYPERILLTFFNVSDVSLGARPGTGRPAFISFKKYFCTLLETCMRVLFPKASAIF